jgi:hypothetical protein
VERLDKGRRKRCPWEGGEEEEGNKNNKNKKKLIKEIDLDLISSKKNH